MKRTLAAISTLLVGIVPLRKEGVEDECKDRQCVNEVPVRETDQPHTHEEHPNYASEEYITVMASPVYTIRRTPENLRRVQEQGLDWESGIG